MAAGMFHIALLLGASFTIYHSPYNFTQGFITRPLCATDGRHEYVYTPVFCVFCELNQEVIIGFL